MKNSSAFVRSGTALLRDRGGNFGIMAAIVFPVLLASGGIALDMTNALIAKNELQAATDAAALAASSALVNNGITQDAAKTLARNFLNAQISSAELESTPSGKDKDEPSLADQLAANTVVTITQAATLGNSKSFTVAVSTSRTVSLNPMTKLIGKDAITVGTHSVSTSSTEAKNALSMFLVLDRSGSMAEDTATVNPDKPTKTYTYDCSYYSGKKYVSATCTGTQTNYITKIEALKTATEKLLTQLKTADTTNSLVRTGAVSYNSSMQTAKELTWGTTDVQTYVNALTATGSTDSSAAFAASYNKLMAKNSAGALTEEKAHKDKNGQVPKKYIIFMTDGENNYYNNKSSTTAATNSDNETKKYCELAKAENIQIYAIAFMAPDRGKTLLQSCVSGQDGHYFAAENADQLTAAFKYIGEKASELTVRLTQ